MFLLSLPFTLVHHTITYLYPLYASYKAISSHQSSTTGAGLARSVTGEERTEMAELETWLMYWSVVGAMQIVEGWGEWAWSWLPFYTITKLAFTLWLVLPQTRGATLLYTAYLGPFLRTHEGDIDVALASARRRASEVAGNWIMTIWQQLRSAILGAAMAPDSSPSSSTHMSEPGPTQTPPTLHNPASGGASQLFGLLKHYGPLAAAGVVSAMDKAAAQAAHATGTQPPSGAGASVKLASGDSPDRPVDLDTKTKAKATGTGMPTTRSRANLARSTGTAAAAGGAAATRSSARLAPPMGGGAAAAAAAGRDISSSDWSEDEEDEDSVQARTRTAGRKTRTRSAAAAASRVGAGKQDLSGSYQLVDGGEEMESSIDDDDDHASGAGVGVGVGRERLGGRGTTATATATAAAGGVGGEKSWSAWITGR